MSGWQVFYEGSVQGVGFRWTVKNLARGYEVTGSVRNLPDGRVELRAFGQPEELQAFLRGIMESELKDHIRRVDRQPLAPEGVRGFEIVT